MILDTQNNVRRFLSYLSDEKRQYWLSENRLVTELSGLGLSPENNHLSRIDLFDPNFVNKDFKGSILLSHYALARYEIEGVGLPILLTKMLPNAKIDVTYHKSDKIKYVFSVNLDKKCLEFKERLQDRYDVIIGRSTSIIKMKNFYRSIYDLSGPKINIQTNNVPSNFEASDYCFGIREFFAPADPTLVFDCNQTLKTHKKKDIIVLSGTVFWEKGQKEWFKRVDPSLLRNHEVFISGVIDDKSHANEIADICKKYQLNNVFFLGALPPKLFADLMCISKIHVMNHDSRPIQHPLGVPRTFGEGLACHVLPLSPHKTLKISDEWSHIGIQYDHEDNQSLNSALHDAIKSSESLESIDWTHFDFNQMCERIANKSFDLLRSST
jgi:hypothetical protein